MLNRVDNDTGRLEAFSDGVFAIAMTLLVLDIKVPHDLPEGASLAEALVRQWPTYLAFLTSFATIGIMWINHHRLFRLIARTDHTLLLLNVLLLLVVTFVPFPTSLVAAYVLRPERHVAAMVYSGTAILIAVFYNLLWRYATWNNRLLDDRVNPAAVREITKSYSFGPVLYLLAFVVARFNVVASLAINLGLALFFALPPRHSPGDW